MTGAKLYKEDGNNGVILPSGEGAGTEPHRLDLLFLTWCHTPSIFNVLKLMIFFNSVYY